MHSLLRRRAARLPALGAAIVILGFVASGCAVSVNSQSLSQAHPNQPVHLVTAFQYCVSSADPTCEPTTSQDYQPLLAYQLPAWADAPETITATTGDVGAPALVFTRSAAYTDVVQATAPAPTGSTWVGYAAPFTPVAGLPAKIDYTIDTPLTVDPAAAPLDGSLMVDSKIGWRAGGPSTQGQIVTTLDESRPFACGDTLSSFHDVTNYGFDAICADASTSTTSDVAFVDVQAGAAAITVQAGKTASVPFDVRLAGPNADANLALVAQATAPGSTATPAHPALTPAPNAVTDEAVTVDVPASTPAGDYKVTLTATIPGGAQRSAQRTLHVDPAPAPPAAPPVSPPPAPKLTSFASGVRTHDAAPKFSGHAGDGTKTVTLLVYAGKVASGTPVETQQVPVVNGAWSTKPLTGLAPGAYVAVVQAGAAGAVASSEPIAFEILGPCQSRRVVVLHLYAPKGGYRAITATLGGKHLRMRGGKRAPAVSVDLRGRGKGTYTVRIAGTTARGGHVRATRTFRTCGRAVR